MAFDIFTQQGSMTIRVGQKREAAVGGHGHRPLDDLGCEEAALAGGADLTAEEE
jgi:hypothetical protein